MNFAYKMIWSEELANVMLCYFGADLTWEIYHPVIDKLIETIRTKDERVDVIFVGETPPPKGNPLPHFRRALNLLAQTENLGLVITTGVGINPVTQAVGFFLFKAMALDTDRFIFLTSLEKSYERIRDNRNVSVAQIG